eukprot:PhF_6_TR36295/c0_g2_i2/m.52953
MMDTLSMQRCRQRGTLPSVYLYRVRNLNLKGNVFSGTLPELRSNTVITNFNAAYNSLSGTLPVSWGLYAPDLETFNVNSNFHISGHLPSTWAKLYKLKTFRASRNDLSSIGELTFPPSLELLDLSNNPLVGTFPF